MNEKATVMFVDDEERILRSLSMLFRARYNVITCTDGNEALQVLENQKVHVVVSDQRMPGMVGVDLLRQVRERAPDTMRLLLTGYSDLTAIIGSINEGEVFRFIQKPWQSEELRKTLAEAVEIALTGSEEESVSLPTATGAQILVLDSDDKVIDSVQMATGSVHPVRQVASLNEALEIIAREDVAVLVSETSLAGHDLTAAIKTIKRFNPAIVTIVMTSFSDTGVLVGLINHGQIFRFLPKPIRKGLLEMSLRAALHQHERLKQSPRLLARQRVEPMVAQSELSVGERVLRMLRGFRDRSDPARPTS